jgi:hypothetical protein
MTCSFFRAIDRHFAGRLGPSGERSLREHLPGCEKCRLRYERSMLLAKLDPRGLSAERRIGIGLGIAPPRRRWVVPAFAFATCAAIALVVFGLRDHEREAFQPRGHGEPRLVIYRVPSGGAPVRVTDRIAASDELAFVFENPIDRKRLLVFGVDEHRHVVWYHPSWVDPTLDPVAVPIARGGELPEAIRHELAGHALTVYGVFTDRPVGVKEVERIVRDGGDLRLLGAVHVTTLVVERP